MSSTESPPPRSSASLRRLLRRLFGGESKRQSLTSRVVTRVLNKVVATNASGNNASVR